MEYVVVDNNHLSVDQNRSRSEELVNCQGDSSCRATVRDRYRQEYDRVQARIATCSGAGFPHTGRSAGMGRFTGCDVKY
ncbi:hypothetical protein [Photorhabdus luminescens]|uniref:hypothetical protein n=1 Tax=Photorhabdus luminescens TaxID=29488 RepID=UPI001F001F00|nr:hypothetical protein [Photorhabdus luminescens]